MVERRSEGHKYINLFIYNITFNSNYISTKWHAFLSLLTIVSFFIFKTLKKKNYSSRVMRLLGHKANFKYLIISYKIYIIYVKMSKRLYCLLICVLHWHTHSSTTLICHFLHICNMQLQNIAQILRVSVYSKINWIFKRTSNKMIIIKIISHILKT